ncbi:MAG: alpha/beta fold hydrolase [Deltaproteobacteria bacterium]|nr:alpha/beta fold hydrolase [Deltaproteobacteria bacterium]
MIMQDELIGSAKQIADAWMDVALGALGTPRPQAPPLAQTPRDELTLEGGARLYHFRGAASVTRPIAQPILLVPSLINRWYVLDLRPGASLVEALVGAGFDVWLLDWGVPEAEDRYLDWDAVLRRLGRAARRVLREIGQPRLGVLGYCMGGTLATIFATQHPDLLTALVTLAAPIDFARGGMLRRMVDPQWFDADAVADAGNVAPSQMQAGFTALRPTLDAAKLHSMPELASDPQARAAFLALDAWATDNIPFPAEAYRRYIREMYQGNQLVAGTHHTNGRAAPLGAIRCPTLVITASRDTICPAAAATALLDHVASTDTAVVEVPGGHVGAVVGSKAARDMYPALIRWLAPRLA